MRKLVCSVALLLTVLCSCTTKQSQEEVPTQLLKHEILMGDEYLIGRIRDMELVNDSIPIVANSKSQKAFQLLDYSKDIIKDFGDIGQGPDNFLMPYSLSVSKENTFSFYDLNRRRYSTIYLNEEDGSWRVEHQFKSDSLAHIYVLPIVNNQYIATGMYEDYRLVLLDKDGAFQKGFGELPYRDEEERKVNGMIRSEIYQGELTVSPSGNKVAHALQKADIIYFYTITADGNLILKSEQLKSYPQYRYDVGAIDRDSPLHYMGICSTEEYVYTLYSGRNYKDDKDKAFYGNLIRVYNWDGMLVKQLQLDIDVCQFVVTQDNQEIYAISYLPDPVLVVFNL